jgi:hypothetical protein
LINARGAFQQLEKANPKEVLVALLARIPPQIVLRNKPSPPKDTNGAP